MGLHSRTRLVILCLLCASVACAQFPWRSRTGWGLQYSQGFVQIDSSKIATQYDVDTTYTKAQLDTDTSTWDATRTWVTANSQQDGDTTTWDATKTDVLGTDYAPASLTVIYGSLDVGTVDSLTALDGKMVNVSEATGANALRAKVHFTGATHVDHIDIYGRYEGGSTPHGCQLQLYNFTLSRWEAFEFMTTATFNVWHSEFVINGANYISSTVCSLRFEHQNSGINTHDLWLDYVSIGSGLP